MQHSKGARLWLEKRPGRPAIYYIRDGTHKASTGCGPDRLGEAQEALSRYIAEHTRPNTDERDIRKILVADVLKMYAQDFPTDNGTKTHETVSYHVKALMPYWGDKYLSDVKGSTCRKYVESRTGQRPKNSSLRSVKSATARQELKTLQAAINHWHRESALDAVPQVTLPKTASRRERVLERSEVARLLWACRKLKSKHVARFILIGIYTGTRHDAILQLRWKSDPAGGTVDLARSVIFRRGVAERETSKRRPPVQIGRRLLGHLVRWQRKDSEDAEQEISHVIHYHGQPILKMKRAWHTVVREAGLGPEVTPHTLRHTCASWLLWEGKTIWDVAGILGADASTIERVYGHHRRVEE